MKNKDKIVCIECGYISSYWIGKCPQCNSWNSFIKKGINTVIESKETEKINLKKINEIEISEKESIKFENYELNDFFGDGIICGSVILLSGEPGIGKSTFLLFLSNNLDKKKKIFYFSGEETLSQLKRRIERLKINNENLYLSNNNNLNEILEYSRINLPDIILIDSIQTIKCDKSEEIYSLGNISNIKMCTYKIVEFSKKYNIPFIIIGHINKSGEIAGPKIIEHIVDIVVYFEFDIKNYFRILRSVKNRYGDIDNMLFFDMDDNGLNILDSNNELIKDNKFYSDNFGKCKTVIIEGTKTFLIEIESLVVPSAFVTPRRFSENIDISRLNKIIGILNKYLEENLNNYDIYVNITQGIKIKDVSIDFALAMAIYSSKNNIPIDGYSCFIGELSLTGRIINVKKIENRIRESLKYNINNIYIPEIKIEDKKYNMIDNIREIKKFMIK